MFNGSKETQNEKANCLHFRAVAAAVNFSSVQAQSCDAGETRIDGDCIPSYYSLVIGAVPDIRDANEMRNYQEWDDQDWWDDDPYDGNTGGSGDSQPDDPPGQFCTTTRTSTDLLFRTQADQYRNDQETWNTYASGLGGIAGGALGGAVGTQFGVPYYGATFGATAGLWLGNSLAPVYNIHCGDTLIHEVTLCVPDPTWPSGNPMSPELASRSVDAFVDHQHHRCEDDYDGVIPQYAGSNGKSRVVVIQGVTHYLPANTKREYIQEMNDRASKQRPSTRPVIEWSSEMVTANAYGVQLGQELFRQSQ